MNSFALAGGGDHGGQGGYFPDPETKEPFNIADNCCNYNPPCADNCDDGYILSPAGNLVLVQFNNNLNSPSAKPNEAVCLDWVGDECREARAILSKNQTNTAPTVNTIQDPELLNQQPIKLACIWERNGRCVPGYQENPKVETVKSVIDYSTEGEKCSEGCWKDYHNVCRCGC